MGSGGASVPVASEVDENHEAIWPEITTNVSWNIHDFRVTER